MAIEFAPAALAATKPVPPVPSAPEGKNTPTADSKAADKDGQHFRRLLEGLEATEDAPADPASPAKEADPADGGVARKKLLNTGKSVASGNNTCTADPATWMATYLPPVPVPTATPTAAAPGSGTSDAMDALQGNGSLAASKGGVAGAAGSALAAKAALPGAMPDARAQSVNLANYASVFEQIQSRLSAGAAGAQDALGSGTHGVAKTGLGAAADSRADPMATMTSGGMWVMPVTEAAAVRAATDATEAMQLSKTGDKGEGLSADKLPEGGVGQNHFTPTVHFESAAASVDAGQPAPEAAVADQVSYWISQGIQNAELTFNGADAQPVQVSISLSGKEAHVEFRTDQLETRDLLAGAASHLKDLLQSQGMVLSGVSVGSSGSGGSNARERRAPSEGRQNAAKSGGEVTAVRSAAPKGTSGRAVDLFV